MSDTIVTAALAFIGALAGGWFATHLQIRQSRRQRLEDSYAELIGTATELALLIPIFTAAPELDDERLMLMAAKMMNAQGRVLLQERNEDCRKKAFQLGNRVGDLISTVQEQHMGALVKKAALDELSRAKKAEPHDAARVAELEQALEGCKQALATVSAKQMTGADRYKEALKALTEAARERSKA